MFKKISEFLVERKLARNIRPWSFAFSGYRGNSSKKGTVCALNFPSEIVIPSALDSNVEPEESIACCLRAEHHNRIDQWEKPKKSKEYKYMHNPGYTTLFHFIYRLRIRSNYKDVETFMADAPPENIRSFSTNLTAFTYLTNTLLELIIIKRIGLSKFIEISETFRKRNNKAPNIGRVESYKKFFGDKGNTT